MTQIARLLTPSWSRVEQRRQLRGCWTTEERVCPAAGPGGSSGPGAMFDWSRRWNLSFAGCGFRSVYYLGALSCFLDRVPQLVHGASRICGASSGCLVAAAVTVGVPIDGFCADVLTLARRARRHPLGVLHPAFGLLRLVRDSLLRRLPADAHLRASGRLCVSLTRLADGTNLLVSQFDSREELVQVLLCSCFFPVYSGFIPPSYRGELFLDGALSNNLPLSEQSNTITMAPFTGESDICPKDGSFNPVQVHCCSLGVQNLAEICHSGYVDALRFLRDQGLTAAQLHQPLSLEQPDQDPDPDLEPDPVTPCCGLKPQREDHSWLDPKVMENLPVSFQRVLCAACRVGHDGAGFLWVELLTYLLTLLLLPVELSLFFISSVMSSGWAAIGRLWGQWGSCRWSPARSSSLEPLARSGLSAARHRSRRSRRSRRSHAAGS